MLQKKLKVWHPSPLLKSSYNPLSDKPTMYEFESFLPILEVEFRRKLIFSIGLEYSQLLEEYKTTDQLYLVKTRELWRTVQRFEMMSLERYGLTNTRVNPFEIAIYPPY